ncbi:hypothetical protein Javan174_0043 [Streptococcus phage Javan174]|uniref:hypothetical protein n=1 Tax=Streptococcus entericus TaxID=155680 RepID=UPI0003629478|nr:hypothetical protein [Streptococcus entericus]QBX24109.1 hypothetical protein Javan174_0043 [Streptococcus phage Javan174]
MALYRATKNLVFSKLDKSVIVDETIELEPDYAEQVNKDLKLTFPDVPAVLVAVDADESIKTEKPKKASTRKPKAEVEPSKDDEVVPD